MAVGEGVQECGGQARVRYVAPRPFTGPCSHRDRDYRIRSNFWKFYLIKTGFTFGELVSLVKVFRLFILEQIFFWCSKCGHGR
jgi:hypothetical protein